MTHSPHKSNVLTDANASDAAPRCSPSRLLLYLGPGLCNGALGSHSSFESVRSPLTVPHGVTPLHQHPPRWCVMVTLKRLVFFRNRGCFLKTLTFYASGLSLLCF